MKLSDDDRNHLASLLARVVDDGPEAEIAAAKIKQFCDRLHLSGGDLRNIILGEHAAQSVRAPPKGGKTNGHNSTKQTNQKAERTVKSEREVELVDAAGSIEGDLTVTTRKISFASPARSIEIPKAQITDIEIKEISLFKHIVTIDFNKDSERCVFVVGWDVTWAKNILVPKHFAD